MAYPARSYTAHRTSQIWKLKFRCCFCSYRVEFTATDCSWPTEASWCWLSLTVHSWRQHYTITLPWQLKL